MGIVLNSNDVNILFSFTPKEVERKIAIESFIYNLPKIHIFNEWAVRKDCCNLHLYHLMMEFLGFSFLQLSLFKILSLFEENLVLLVQSSNCS